MFHHVLFCSLMFSCFLRCFLLIWTGFLIFMFSHGLSWLPHSPKGLLCFSGISHVSLDLYTYFVYILFCLMCSHLSFLSCSLTCFHCISCPHVFVSCLLVLSNVFPQLFQTTCAYLWSLHTAHQELNKWSITRNAKKLSKNRMLSKLATCDVIGKRV